MFSYKENKHFAWDMFSYKDDKHFAGDFLKTKYFLFTGKSMDVYGIISYRECTNGQWHKKGSIAQCD